MKKDTPLAESDPDVPCPKCRRALVRGYSRAPHGIQWRTEAEKPLRWRAIWRALPSTLHWWAFRESPSWRCAECGIILIEHGRSVSSREDAVGEETRR